MNKLVQLNCQVCFASCLYQKEEERFDGFELSRRGKKRPFRTSIVDYLPTVIEAI